MKIAWRATADGAVTFSATGPSGRSITPVWGPEAHTGSNWERPGGEWGTGWQFPEPGCWTVHVDGASAHGTAGIRVVG